jgi:hypothetical protein
MSEEKKDEIYEKRIFGIYEDQRDVVLKYIQASPTPQGVSVAVANNIVTMLMELPLINLLPSDKPASRIEPKIPGRNNTKRVRRAAGVGKGKNK